MLGAPVIQQGVRPPDVRRRDPYAPAVTGSTVTGRLTSIVDRRVGLSPRGVEIATTSRREVGPPAGPRMTSRRGQ
jgi:hypothetical protein